MSRRFAISTALVAVLFALAAAQDPKPKTDPDAKKAASAGAIDKLVSPADKKKADPTDAAVAAALRNDPDVKVAQAKMQLAEAELAKAKQVVVVKVMALVAKIKELQPEVEQFQERAAWADRMTKLGYMSATQAQAERSKLESAKAALAKAQTELKLLTGDDRAALKAWLEETADHDAATAGLLWLSRIERYERSFQTQSAAAALLAAIGERQSVKGPIPDRIRTALDKPVTLAAKGEKVSFDKALEVFRKSAGLDVPVRGALPLRPVHDPKNPNEMKSGPIEIVSEGEELPVGAWFQLFEDNAVFPQRGGNMLRFRFYVREYGLLVSSSDAAPPDAPTLTDFWKQKPPAKSEGAPDPKPKN
jgi:hypothetical protein